MTTDEEVRLLRRLRNDIEPLLQDGGLTIGAIMERLMGLDKFYKHEISANRLHVSIQLMARLYDRDFCRTHRSSTKLFLKDHPKPPMPIKPITARCGQTRASRIAEAVEDREDNRFMAATPHERLTQVFRELKEAAERWRPNKTEETAARPPSDNGETTCQ